MPYRAPKQWMTKPPVGVVDWGDPINKDLICWYLMGEGGGLNVWDITGRQAKGAFTNTPTWDKGIDGPAVAFDQSAVKEITLPTAIKGFDVNEGSVGIWVYLASNVGQPETYLNFKLDANNEFQFYNYFGSFGLEMQFERHAGGTVDAAAATSRTLLVWKHHVFTWSVKSATVKNFMNGILQQSTTLTGTWSGGNPTGNYIGGNNAANRSLSGKVDGMRIWNRELKAPEAMRLYSNKLAGLVAPRRRIICQAAGGWGRLQGGARNRLVYS